MQDPVLVLAMHGTASPAGAATTERIAAAVQAARPSTAVRLCYLDVAAPRLAEVLASLGGPAVVVPGLLSTGYHVQTDIPTVVATYPEVRTAAHLGPDPLVIDALVEQLAETPGGASLALVGVGSSRPDAYTELAAAGRLLGERLGRRVHVDTVASGLKNRLRTMRAPVQVATYLLAEGQFADAVQDAVAGIGVATAPIGAHPALVRLVWARYDAALAR